MRRRIKEKDDAQREALGTLIATYSDSECLRCTAGDLEVELSAAWADIEE